ncbi:MAG: hypothetical protein A2Y62_02925 [Candidatus Fischerbacteria bacterium RBG_13_37_8]|uniref:Methyltransferase type 11 domain-containing protein n=1 Tax=Candidatus Fischerbacteria bacterium RBG_13_37_8 TaxID=1817863 RepID=A0A1F5VXW2_9BACT|nr:MAG: hypothetical protein A2Y62_02925 [Candidatus Fischerbacteria bacterium RBG_13_37_8]
MIDKLKQVENFWDRNLCGKHFINAKFPSKDFFEQYRNFRYHKEHHLNSFNDYPSALNKDVLEIGIGIGADGTQWAKYAKSYTGIDITDEAIYATKLHFNILGLKGNFLKSNAESLPFHDNKFDIVYSHGVLHHILNIENALSEVYRVLRPKCKLILMLYSKDSFNYWIRIQLYFRFWFLLELLKKKFCFKIKEPWESHIKSYNIFGWSYFSWKNWHHHCTDGPDCQIANIYNKDEIIDMLNKADLVVEKIRKAHFPISCGLFPNLERLLAKYIGFYYFVWAVKA